MKGSETLVESVSHFVTHTHPPADPCTQTHLHAWTQVLYHILAKTYQLWMDWALILQNTPLCSAYPHLSIRTTSSFVLLGRLEATARHGQLAWSIPCAQRYPLLKETGWANRRILRFLCDITYNDTSKKGKLYIFILINKAAKDQ